MLKLLHWLGVIIFSNLMIFRPMPFLLSHLCIKPITICPNDVCQNLFKKTRLVTLICEIICHLIIIFLFNIRKYFISHNCVILRNKMSHDFFGVNLSLYSVCLLRVFETACLFQIKFDLIYLDQIS